MGGDLKEVGEAGIWGRAFLAKGTASAKSEHQSQPSTEEQEGSSRRWRTQRVDSGRSKRRLKARFSKEWTFDPEILSGDMR